MGGVLAELLVEKGCSVNACHPPRPVISYWTQFTLNKDALMNASCDWV